MILLDPDLDPYPAPHANTAKRPFTSSDSTNPFSQRTPSARTLARFLAAAQAAVRLRGQVTVLLTTDEAIRNKATDVLSFPVAGPAEAEFAGDLAISVPTALRQASARGHALGVELKVLMLHGLLHLAGYDHETDAGRMARRERLLRSRLGLPQGLIERADEPEHAARKQNQRNGARR
jgi:probable rRNA maturation factor